MVGSARGIVVQLRKNLDSLDCIHSPEIYLVFLDFSTGADRSELSPREALTVPGTEEEIPLESNSLPP